MGVIVHHAAARVVVGARLYTKIELYGAGAFRNKRFIRGGEQVITACTDSQPDGRTIGGLCGRNSEITKGHA